MFSSNIDFRTAGLSSPIPENTSRVLSNGMREQAMRDQTNQKMRETFRPLDFSRRRTIFDDDEPILPVNPIIDEKNGLTNNIIPENSSLVSSSDLKYISRNLQAQKDIATYLGAQNAVLQGNYGLAEILLKRKLTASELMRRDVDMNQNKDIETDPRRQLEMMQDSKDTFSIGPESLLDSFQMNQGNYYSRINVMRKSDVAKFYDALQPYGLTPPFARTNDVMRRKLIEFIRDNIFDPMSQYNTGIAPVVSVPTPVVNTGTASASTSVTPAPASSILTRSSSSGSTSSVSSASASSSSIPVSDQLAKSFVEAEQKKIALAAETKDLTTTGLRVRDIVRELAILNSFTETISKQVKTLTPAEQKRFQTMVKSPGNKLKKGKGLKDALKIITKGKKLDKTAFGLNMMNADRLKERLSILTGEIESGNDSIKIKNELSDLMRVMQQQNLLTKHKATRITRLYILNNV